MNDLRRALIKRAKGPFGIQKPSEKYCSECNLRVSESPTSDAEYGHAATCSRWIGR